MIKVLQKHYFEAGIALLRFLAGLGIMMHGYQKLFVNGMNGFVNSVADMGFPAPLLFAWLGALSEFLGGILVAVGLGTRFAAVFVAATMFVAAFIRHAGDSFFGREKSLLYLTIMVSLFLTGGGKYSLDHLIRQRRKGAGEQH